jgi:hypothetical protein
MSPQGGRSKFDSIRVEVILRRMIRRSFPRLRRQNVSIQWGEEEDLLSYRVEDGRHALRVNDCLRGAPERVLQGGIGHELCHIDGDLRMGPFQRQLAWESYYGSRWRRMREERAVERRAIELGYGRQLLAFVRYARRLGYTFSREHGLLYAEIERAVTARGKV